MEDLICLLATVCTLNVGISTRYDMMNHADSLIHFSDIYTNHHNIYNVK